MRWAVRERNFFVERILPAGVARRLTAEEMEHYRAVQPTPASRMGVVEFPRQIVAATPWLEELARDVPARLGAKRTLITWPGRDVAFPEKRTLPQVRGAFRDVTVLRLPQAKHFFPEDAADEVAAAIGDRFSGATDTPA